MRSEIMAAERSCIKCRLTWLRDSNEAEKEEPQPQKKRGKYFSGGIL